MKKEAVNGERGHWVNLLSTATAATVARASSWLGRVEDWTVLPAGLRPAIAVGRVQGLARALSTARSGSLAMVRGGLLAVLSYLPAHLRLACLISIASDKDAGLGTLLEERNLPPAYAQHRRNVLASMVAVARFALLQDMLGPDRLERVRIAAERMGRSGRGAV